MSKYRLGPWIAIATILMAGPAAAFVYLVCGNQRVTWKADPVVLRASPISFPTGHAFTNALGTAVSRWNLNPSQLSFLLHLHDSGGVNLGNDQNEVWFSDDSDLLEDARAVVFNQYDCGSSSIVESDVVFDVDVPNTPSEYKWALSLYGGSGRPFVALAIHELGHVAGLQHEVDVYGIMLGLAHTHTNGNNARAYPGEDTVNGAVFLYGLDTPRRQDVAAAHWKIIQLEGLGTVGMYRTAVWDHEPEEWSDFVDTVDGFVHWRDLEGEPRFRVHNGQRIWPEFTYENNGADLQTSVTAHYYLSSDDLIDDNDRRFAGRTLTLGRNVPWTVALPVTLPNDLPENSDHTLGVLLDGGNTIAESMQEANNATYVRIRIEPTYPLALSFSPAYVDGGDSTTGTVTLIGAAPSGGVPIYLYTSDPYVTVPAQVSVPAGQMTATFPVDTEPIYLGTGYHRADVSAWRSGVSGWAEGSLYVEMIPQTVTDETFCEANPGSVACTICDQLPELPQCGPMFDFEDPPWPPDPPWYELPFKNPHGQPSHLRRMTRLMGGVLQLERLADLREKDLAALRAVVAEAPARIHFDGKQKRALQEQLAETRVLEPRTVYDLMVAANAMAIDLRVPELSPRDLDPGPYKAAAFGDVAYVGLAEVAEPACLTLTLNEGLPGEHVGFWPTWPVMTYRFSGDTKCEYADVTFSVEGLVPSELLDQLRLYEWSGADYRDITTYVDTGRGTLSGRTSHLKQYVVGRMKTVKSRDGEEGF